MRVLVTGAPGFIGQAVVRRLVASGDAVRAIVRDPTRAPTLADLGVEIRTGELVHGAVIEEAMRGTQAVVHVAGDYRVGIPASDRPAMLDSNLGATSRVLDAATAVGLERMVMVSTVSVFGNTRGRIVDERYRRDLSDGFLGYYDETKFLAHRAVEERIGNSAPAVIVMPGVVYGPGDHSDAGRQLRRAYDGTLSAIFVGGLGVSLSHVDDAADGIVAALHRGRLGESYVIAGENVRMRDALRSAARIAGRPPPRLEVPDAVVRFGSHAPAWLARQAGYPDDLGEVARASIGVTYWASSAKAATELGYRPRDLQSGLRAAFDDD
jgi:nucleoside-diphosphate-sugar epimerase